MSAYWVLDTSVVLKWIRQNEVLADHARALLQAYLDGAATVTVPTLLAYELTNVLRYKQELTTEQIEVAVQAIFDLDIMWEAPSATTLCRAAALARECDTSVYDATFAVLAEHVGADFITADARLVRQLAHLAHVRFLGDVVVS